MEKNDVVVAVPPVAFLNIKPPILSTEKTVSPVEDASERRRDVVSVEVAAIENFAKGDVVPIPRFPEVLLYEKPLTPPNNPPLLNCIWPAEPPAGVLVPVFRHAPLTAKQPPVKLILLANVDVAVVDATVSTSEAMPPANVDTPVYVLFKSPVSVPPERAR